MKKNIIIIVLSVLLIACLAYIFLANRTESEFYTQDKFLEDDFESFVEELRNDSTVRPEHGGKRVLMSYDSFRNVVKNHKDWKNRNNYKRSRIRTGEWPNRFNRVKTTTSFTFHINNIRLLLSDIDRHDPDSVVQGLRFQLYESVKYRNNPKINLVDAYIMPTDQYGNPIISVEEGGVISTSRLQNNNDLGLIINTSNPCPDYCD